jgi:glycosyltransferase involved in cell wall biosynthesis
MNPEITVVIPLYNKERYIQRTIDSVLRQTFQNFECIIVDSSTDGSRKLVSQYDDPRIVLVSCEKSTAAHARNQGAHTAQSDLIAFLDADDEWQPDHLESLHNLRKNYPDAGIYSTPYIKIRANGRPMVMLFAGIPRPPWEGFIRSYLRSCSLGDEPVHSSSCAVPRTVFNAMGGFPENLMYGEDQFLWGNISLRYPIAYTWKGLTIYHTESLGRICDEKHAIEEHPFSVYLKQELLLGNISPEKQRDCRAYIRRKRYTEIFSAIIAGKSTPRGAGALIKYPSVHVGKMDEKYCGLKRIIGRSFNRFYDSSVHDVLRQILVLIYRCYDPGTTLSLGSQVIGRTETNVRLHK